MEQIRKPFQGVLNIIRFNWHFYAIALALTLFSFFTANYLEKTTQTLISALCILILGTILSSLFASFYVYDLSGLYMLKWVDQRDDENLIVNINAGFDETSALLKNKFKNAELVVLDFYDPTKHTEISIKRARAAYPCFPKTKRTETTNLPLANNSADRIFVILSAHEIRNEHERTAFFKELARVIKPTGRIYITEHLRDVPNFMAYNIGFIHFYTKKSWLLTFKNSSLLVCKELKITPFISTFILAKNGNAF